MQYITALFLWTGLAASVTVAANQGKSSPNSGKNNSPPSGPFFSDQANSLGAGNQSGQPSAPIFTGYSAGGYGARAAGQAAGYGGTLAGYAPSSAFGGAPAGYPGSIGFLSPAGYGIGNNGLGGAPSGSEAGSVSFANGNGFEGVPAPYASSSGFGGAPAAYASSSLGSGGNEGSSAPASPVGIGTYGSPQNRFPLSTDVGSPSARNSGHEGSPSAGVAGPNSPSGLLLPNSSVELLGPHPSSGYGAGMYGYGPYASAGNPSLGGLALNGLHSPLGPNSPTGFDPSRQVSSPYRYASSGFAAAPQGAYSAPRGYGQYGSGPPSFAADFSSSPNGGDGHIFKPYFSQGSAPMNPGGPGNEFKFNLNGADLLGKLQQARSNARKSIGSSSRFAGSGKTNPAAKTNETVDADAAAAAEPAAGPVAPSKLKNPQRSVGNSKPLKSDSSRKKSKKSKKSKSH